MRQAQSSAAVPRSSAEIFGIEVDRLVRSAIERRGKKRIERFAGHARAKSLALAYPDIGHNSVVECEFEVSPLVLLQDPWIELARAVEQRARATEAFLNDLHGKREAILSGVIDERIAFGSLYSPTLGGISPPGGNFSFLSSSEFALGGNGRFYCVEKGNPTVQDIANLRANRAAMQLTFPEFFTVSGIASTDEFFENFRASLVDTSNVDNQELCIAVAAESQFPELDYIAERIGAITAIWSDLRVSGGKISVRTIGGPKTVHVICHFGQDLPDPISSEYRNIRGVSGIAAIYRAGKLIASNSPRSGIASNNLVHAKFPDLIRFYLNEEPSLENWPCRCCGDAGGLEWALDNIGGLEILEARKNGGTPVFNGATAEKSDIIEIRKGIENSTCDYIARVPKASTSIAEFNALANSRNPESLTLFALRKNGEFTAIEGGVSRIAVSSDLPGASATTRPRDVWVMRDGADAIAAC